MKWRISQNVQDYKKPFGFILDKESTIGLSNVHKVNRYGTFQLGDFFCRLTVYNPGNIVIFDIIKC